MEYLVAQGITPHQHEPFPGTNLLLQFDTTESVLEIKQLLGVPDFVWAAVVPRDDMQGFRCTTCRQALSWKIPLAKPDSDEGR